MPQKLLLRYAFAQPTAPTPSNTVDGVHSRKHAFLRSSRSVLNGSYVDHELAGHTRAESRALRHALRESRQNEGSLENDKSDVKVEHGFVVEEMPTNKPSKRTRVTTSSKRSTKAAVVQDAETIKRVNNRKGNSKRVVPKANVLEAGDGESVLVGPKVESEPISTQNDVMDSAIHNGKKAAESVDDLAIDGNEYTTSPRRTRASTRGRDLATIDTNKVTVTVSTRTRRVKKETTEVQVTTKKPVDGGTASRSTRTKRKVEIKVEDTTAVVVRDEESHARTTRASRARANVKGLDRKDVSSISKIPTRKPGGVITVSKRKRTTTTEQVKAAPKLSPIAELKAVWKTNVAKALPAKKLKLDTKSPSKSSTDAQVSTALVVKKVVKPPADWQRIWDLIWELRADRTAVVDYMGSEAISEADLPKHVKDWQTLVSLMLSSQTKDITNAATMKILRAYEPGGLTVETVRNMTHGTLNEMINKVGFHNQKTIRIKQVAQILHDEYDGKIPDTFDGLVALPGVGPKMAIITLRVAFNNVMGISVDTHVHQIANKLKWTGPKGMAECNTPERTRAAIESWIPYEMWGDVNIVLVGLGQEIQTEKEKLLKKCLACSDPDLAFTLLGRLDMDVKRGLERFGLSRYPLLSDK